MWILTLLAFLSSSRGILLAMLHYGSGVKHDTRASTTTIIGGIWGCIHSSNRNTRSRSTHCYVPWNITLNVHTPLVSYLEDTYTRICIYLRMQYGYTSYLLSLLSWWSTWHLLKLALRLLIYGKKHATPLLYFYGYTWPILSIHVLVFPTHLVNIL